MLKRCLLALAICAGVALTTYPTQQATAQSVAPLTWTSIVTTGTSGNLPVLYLTNQSVCTFQSTGTATVTPFGSSDGSTFAQITTAAFGVLSGAGVSGGALIPTSGTPVSRAFYVSYSGVTGTVTITETCSAQTPASSVLAVTGSGNLAVSAGATPNATITNAPVFTGPVTTAQLISKAGSSSTAILANGDGLFSESSSNGRLYWGQALGGNAAATIYISLTALQVANSLGPTAGDILTVTVNAHAVNYTVVAGDTSTPILATSEAAALNADATDSAILTATTSGSNVILTANATGTSGRYSVAVSVSGGATENLQAFPRMDIADGYLDYFTYAPGIPGFTLATNLGAYTFDNLGDFTGPAGHNFQVNAGPGSSSHALVVNSNSAGNYAGLIVHDGTASVGDWIYPFNVSVFTGPLYQELCTVPAANCTNAPSSPGYVGEWLFPNGSPTAATQHQVWANCSKGNVTCSGSTMTITFSPAWTAIAQYACTVTSETSMTGNAPYISTKGTTSIVFTFPSAVTAADAICAGY